MKLLTVDNVYKKFNKTEVLKGISFAVEEHEVLAIIGPSGSGKSTLLRCATLLERIDSGYIGYGDSLIMVKNNESNIAEYSDKQTLARIKRRFGLVFQNFNLFPHLSARRNITEALTLVAKIPVSQANARADELLKKVGLSDRENAYPCELSGGQQQRVAIARALAMQPDILFFDEPTSALDPELTGEILKVIRDLASEKMTMVIVTHEMAFARDVADRIIFMDEGVIVESGKAADVINNPQADRTKAFLSRFN